MLLRIRRFVSSVTLVFLAALLLGINACPETDKDGDGLTTEQGDCDDENPFVSPVAYEACKDGIDNDCDGKTESQGDVVYIFHDYPDYDGYGVKPLEWSCSYGFVPFPYAWKSTECDENTSDLSYYGAVEITDGIDNDCDRLIDEDVDTVDNDLDGFSEDQGDCNDADLNTNPDAAENPFANPDEDCNGRHLDYDGDTHITYSYDDCNDYNTVVYKEAPELCDGRDNDCDHYTDEDSGCPAANLDYDGDGYAPESGDCNDFAADTWGDPTTGAGAVELCDGRDNDCNWSVDEGLGDTCDIAIFDRDWDGLASEDGDCIDYNAAAYPGALEIEDNIDNDCDGVVDNTQVGSVRKATQIK